MNNTTATQPKRDVSLQVIREALSKLGNKCTMKVNKKEKEITVNVQYVIKGGVKDTLHNESNRVLLHVDNYSSTKIVLEGKQYSLVSRLYRDDISDTNKTITSIDSLIEQL